MLKANFPATAALDDLHGVHHIFHLLLGREPQSVHEVRFYAQKGLPQAIGELVTGREFAKEIEAPLRLVGYASAGRFQGHPTWRLIRWLQSSFPLSVNTRAAVEMAEDWRALISALWTDTGFIAALKQSGVPAETLQELGGLIALNRDSSLCLTGNGHAQVIDGVATCLDIGALEIMQEVSSPVNVLASATRLIGLEKVRDEYVSVQADPQIMIKLKLKSGSYKLSLKGLFRHENGVPVGADKAQLFFDFGNGYSEEYSFIFPIRGGRLDVSSIVKFDQPPRSMRFDPTDIKCNFSISSFSLSAMSPLEHR
ncbi:hypothetical protein [Rhizobium sp. ZPR3]|uniref:Uncharacterized protein n=2 Tax=unclassified Rhizobium TaxID=2613769 RepID=A0AAU7SAR6_9HYPH